VSAQTQAPTADELVRTVSGDGDVAVRALDGTRLVAEATRRHRTAPTASAALGRALMGATLLASGSKTDETVQLSFHGDGPLGAVTAIANSVGRARGFVAHPGTHLPPRGNKLDVGGAVGKGILAVVRSAPAWREPYRGIVPLASGEIAEDIAQYLRDSEQVSAAVALGVLVGSDGAVAAAGGFLVQVLPGATDAAVATVERNVLSLPTPTEMLRAGVDADGVVDRLLAGLGSRDRHRSSPEFACGCGRERALRTVILLGREEVLELCARNEELEVRCEFCAERYLLPPDEVARLVADA
jgi:molecular chaperone Hsp33